MEYLMLGDRRVGSGYPCFVIAEAGVNHNGDPEMAIKLVDIARESGADAIKFQTFKAERIVSKDACKAAYQKETTSSCESQLDMIKRLELKEDDFKELASYARKKGMMFLSSPFDKESADLLEKLDVPAYKLASGEISNFPLLRHISRKGKPIILSTGMATLGEIEEALGIIRSEGLKDIILMHCVSSYPAMAKDVNLRAVDTLRCAFKLPVGYSDHTQGIVASLAAVAMGSCIIEKHFTLDRALPGPDHRSSLNPLELKEMISGIRYVESLFGNGMKGPTKEEEETKKIVRKSIVAKENLPQGIRIDESMLDIKRPGTGIEPKYLEAMLGRRTKVGIKKDEILTWEKVE